MGAVAGDPRANAHYIELHKIRTCVARRATKCVSAQGCAVVQLLSQSPHLQAPGELRQFAQSTVISPLFTPFDYRLSRELSLAL
jgi:hypothetical protein